LAVGVSDHSNGRLYIGPQGFSGLSNQKRLRSKTKNRRTNINPPSVTISSVKPLPYHDLGIYAEESISIGDYWIPRNKPPPRQNRDGRLETSFWVFPIATCLSTTCYLSLWYWDKLQVTATTTLCSTPSTTSLPTPFMVLHSNLTQRKVGHSRTSGYGAGCKLVDVGPDHEPKPSHRRWTHVFA